MSDIEGDRVTLKKDQAAEEDEDDELPELPDDEEGEGDDVLPEITENGEDMPDLPEADQKDGDLPEADQENDEMETNTEHIQENGDVQANGDLSENKKKKKKRPEDAERKGKKKKKGDKKAAYSKDDILEKRIGPRVRSFDASKMKNKFEKPKAPQQISSDCKLCGKQVFQMEKIVAEKASWHKNCFRCKECNKALTLDTYSSHEGVMYCKPHFKNLFQPKAVIEDPEEAHKERLARRPKLIVVESKPEELPADVVRATQKADYGLEDLSTTMDLKSKFSMFESLTKEEDEKPRLESASVRRSSSLINKAAKFMNTDDDEYGVDNTELGEFEEEDEEEEYEEDEEEEVEEEEGESEYDENGDKIEKPKVIKRLKKKERPNSFAGMGDLQNAFEKKTRREKMSQQRKEELSKFRQMLCAGKNITLKEKFESGNFDEEDGRKGGGKESVKIEGVAARSLKERFEKGEGLDNEGGKYVGEREEVNKIFKEAETANRARNLFKQIDSQAINEDENGSPKVRSNRERKSQDGWDGVDPNEEEDAQVNIDCPNTQNILNMFRKMELQEDDDDAGPRPLKQFTPPPEGESFDEDSEDEYSDEDEDDEEYSSDEEEDSEEDGQKYKDEYLDMNNSSQSAKKAAHIRAKFEKWETEVERQNELNKSPMVDEVGEVMPSIDTARNLRAMFENKAKEDAQPLKKAMPKVNRFVGGGGDKCLACTKTVYAMEKLELAGGILHKNCFKCVKCNNKLSMGSFSIGGDKFYCTTHYKQAFTEKGSYDIFTSDKDKSKWANKIESPPEEPVKSQE